MKQIGQGKKEFVVEQFDDYTNSWKVWSVPLTIKQAYFILARKNQNYYRIVSI